jgi:HSP20 family protein
MFQDIEQRFDDLRRDLLGRWNEPTYGGLLPTEFATTPACDVIDHGNEYVATLDVPGFDKKDIHVDVEDHGLRVWGSTTRETTPKEAPRGRQTWLRRERTAQSFERYVTFPEEVSADGTRASYKNGVLEVTLPKTAPERRRSKSIDVL